MKKIIFTALVSLFLLNLFIGKDGDDKNSAASAATVLRNKEMLTKVKNLKKSLLGKSGKVSSQQILIHFI